MSEWFDDPPGVNRDATRTVQYVAPSPFSISREEAKRLEDECAAQRAAEFQPATAARDVVARLPRLLSSQQLVLFVAAIINEITRQGR
jgi:hypothetical protein